MFFYLRLFLKFVRYRFKAQLEYPGAYAAGIVTQVIGRGITMFLLLLTVWRFGTLAGWLPAEVIFLYAVWLLCYGIGASFTFSLMWRFQDMAVSGSLDEALVRPVPTLLYLIATNFNIGYVAHISLTVTALGFCIHTLGIAALWTVLHWIWFIVLIIAGAVINACMMLLSEMPAIRTRSESPFGVLYWGLRDFYQYPISIYPHPIQFIFTAVLPYAFINFYPTQVLLGKQDGLFAPVSMWLSPLVAVLLIGLTAGCWKMISQKYESAGT